MQILETALSGTPVMNWRGAIDSVGTGSFSSETIRTLDHWVGVEHYAAFCLDLDDVTLVSADSARGTGKARAMGMRYSLPDFCGRDPTIPMARRASADGSVSVLRVDPTRLADDQLRQEIYLSQGVCDRVFICGMRDGHSYGLSMIRTAARGRFNAQDLGCIHAMADTWLSLIAKHERMVGVSRPVEIGEALLGSVADIETRLREAMPALTRRENQVCARILRGMSTPGIAVDLVLREDSVATYRKRAYRRLGIGTRFELIQRFLGSGRETPAARPLSHH